MPTINLTEDELAAVTTAVRRAIETDKFLAPRASIRCARRSALAKLDPATASKPTPPPAKADKRARQ